MRYDRVRLPAWALGTAAALYLWVASVISSYPTAQDRVGEAKVFVRSAAAVRWTASCPAQGSVPS